MKIINYINQKWRVMFTLAISILMFNIGYSQDPGWGSAYETVPFDNEFSATLGAVQVFIDGVEQTGGQLAAFGEDGEISAWDGDGATFFPPGGTNLYELSVWSNYAGEVMTFQYYDAANDVVINLNETYTFIINDVISDAFDPLQLTVFPDCGEPPTQPVFTK